MSVIDQIRLRASVYQSPVCLIPGCNEPRKIRQYCSNHYAALKRRNEHPKNEPQVRTRESHLFIIKACEYKSDECLIWPYSQYDGYPYLGFMGKTRRVHVLVCEHVNGPQPSDIHEVAHECGHSLCCNPAHLAWKTHRENILDKVRHGTMPLGEKHHGARLKQAEVLEIRGLRGKVTRKALAERYGVGISTIDNIIDGITWRHVA